MSIKVLTRGQKVIRFIEGFLRVPEGDKVGQRVILEDFQKAFIIAIYDNPHGTKKAILSMARKNGKTALIAMLVIAHLLGPEAKVNSRIVSGAMSKKQAAEVFNYASKILNFTPRLKDLATITPSQKTITAHPMNVQYSALSAEGKTNMGGSPILAILDETGQVIGAQDEFIDSVTTSQGAYDDALLLVISTQAASDADLLSIWIDDALKGEDPQVVCHLYTTPKDADLLDEKSYHLSNPALGKYRSLVDMKAQAREASRLPSAENKFRNLCLNQRVSTRSPFLSETAWKKCAGDLPPIEVCEAVYGGLDLSKRTDLTAMVLYGLCEGKWYCYPSLWTPEQGLRERAKRDRAPYETWVNKGHLIATPGATVNYKYVATALMEALSLPNFKKMAFDRWRMDILKAALSDIGVTDIESLPLQEWGQGFKDMTPALEALEEQVLNKKFVHDNNPVMNMCAMNTMITQDPSGNRKPDKLKASGRIDGMVALVMAAGIAERLHEKEMDIEAFLSAPIIS